MKLNLRYLTDCVCTKYTLFFYCLHYRTNDFCMHRNVIQKIVSLTSTINNRNRCQNRAQFFRAHKVATAPSIENHAESGLCTKWVCGSNGEYNFELYEYEFKLIFIKSAMIHVIKGVKGEDFLVFSFSDPQSPNLICRSIAYVNSKHVTEQNLCYKRTILTEHVNFSWFSHKKSTS